MGVLNVVGDHRSERGSLRGEFAAMELSFGMVSAWG